MGLARIDGQSCKSKCGNRLATTAMAYLEEEGRDSSEVLVVEGHRNCCASLGHKRTAINGAVRGGNRKALIIQVTSNYFDIVDTCICKHSIRIYNSHTHHIGHLLLDEEQYEAEIM